jgi:Trk K+ transport system NAD-binding subunit
MHDPDFDADEHEAADHTVPSALLEADAEGVVAVVAETADGDEECTLFPADADEAELPTTWLSADSGSFVALSEMR